jgi:hypothetical protein
MLYFKPQILSKKSHSTCYILDHKWCGPHVCTLQIEPFDTIKEKKNYSCFNCYIIQFFHYEIIRQDLYFILTEGNDYLIDYDTI